MYQLWKKLGHHMQNLAWETLLVKEIKGRIQKERVILFLVLFFSLSFLVNLSKGLREEILDTLSNWSFLSCLPIPK